MSKRANTASNTAGSTAAIAPDDAAARLRPTARGWALFAFGLVLIAAGEFFGLATLRYVGLAFAMLPPIVYLLRLLFPPKLELERTVYPTTVAAGDRLRVVAELRNRSVIGVEASAYADVVTGAAARSVGGVLPAIASRLHPREGRRRRRIAYGLSGLRRGIQHVGPLNLEHLDGFGLTRAVQRIGEAVEIEVWPHLHDVDRLDVPALRTGAEVDVAQGRSGEADDVITREYRRGDAMRRVHWRASARAGELRVRQEEHHSEVVAMVVLDSRAFPDAQGTAPLVDDGFELAVSAAASVLKRLHELGYDTEAFATHPTPDADGALLDGVRTPADQGLGAIMRRYMLVLTGDAEDAGEIGAIVDRAMRVGSGPLVYVGRTDQPAEAIAIDLAAAGSPPVAVLITPGGMDSAATKEAERFAAAGWQVVTMNADARDPWATAARVGGAA